MDPVVNWQRAEGVAAFVSGLLIFDAAGAGLAWWMAVLIFFAPDLSFAGYAMGPRIGAFAYNLVHVYAFGAVCIAIGLVGSAPVAIALGGLWLAHSGFDRALGFGLKSSQGFGVTHLGPIGKPTNNE